MFVKAGGAINGGADIDAKAGAKLICGSLTVFPVRAYALLKSSMAKSTRFFRYKYKKTSENLKSEDYYE